MFEGPQFLSGRLASLATSTSKARKGNLVCSEKVQFAPQSRNCEVEGELARDKTSSIFIVEEEVAVFEN